MFPFILSFCFPPLICFPLQSTSSPVSLWTRDTRSRVGACVCVSAYCMCTCASECETRPQQTASADSTYGKNITEPPTHTSQSSWTHFTPDAGGLCVPRSIPQTQMGPWTPRTGLRPGAFLAVGPERSAHIVGVQAGWLNPPICYCCTLWGLESLSHTYRFNFNLVWAQIFFLWISYWNGHIEELDLIFFCCSIVI